LISDRDIWRAANLLIRRHSGDAEIVAAQRADQMLDQGDEMANSCGCASGVRLSSYRLRRAGYRIDHQRVPRAARPYRRDPVSGL